MREREFFLPSSDGKTRLRCMEWIPDQEPGAVLQFAHGMIEHVERYREFAEFLARRGIAVYGHDHLGHGKTVQREEDFGYFGDSRGTECLIKDIRRLTVYGRRRYPGAKHFLLGHSMGSFLVRRYLSVYEDGPDGVILLGTGSPAVLFVMSGYLMSSLFCCMKGKRFQSRILYELSLGAYNRKFRPVSSAHDWLTRDTEKSKQYGEDKYCRFLFTAGAYRDFFEIILKVQRAERKGVIRTQFPFLVLSGEKDPVGEETRGVRRVCRRYDKAGADDMTVGFYGGARHEILNETNRIEVYHDIFQWIMEHQG
ncbi:alpha/beta fold hydrolase [bacterium 1XD42-94]|nr:alpha/beta fold hydrolase [bacterium 1XD42-76]NBK06146.1 alpha/beta fold hydrolase [bacterium 1XD42-94]